MYCTAICTGGTLEGFACSIFLRGGGLDPGVVIDDDLLNDMNTDEEENGDVEEGMESTVDVVVASAAAPPSSTGVREGENNEGVGGAEAGSGRGIVEVKDNLQRISTLQNASNSSTSYQPAVASSIQEPRRISKGLA